MSSLKKDAEKIILEVVGKGNVSVMNTFKKSEPYPDEFLKDCEYFFAQLVGEDVAKKKFKPLYKKYKIKRLS